MFDVKSNYKLMTLRVHAEQVVGAANQLAVDLRSYADPADNYGNSDFVPDMFVILDVDVAPTGTLDIDIEHSEDNVTFTKVGDVAQIAADGRYYFSVKNLKRYVRLAATVGTANVTWGAYGIGINAKRRPVVQADFTEKAVTLA